MASGWKGSIGILIAAVLMAYACDDITDPIENLPTPDSINVLLNGGFEHGTDTGPLDWTATNASISGGRVSFRWDNSEQHSGNRSASIEISPVHLSNGVFYSWSQSLPSTLVVGGTYEFSAWIKTSSVSGAANIEMAFMNLMSNERLSVINSRDSIVLPGTSDWTRVSMTFSVPERTDGISVRAGIVTQADIGSTVWFDDLAITAIEVPGTTQDFDPAWIEWIHEHAFPISSTSSDNFDDLQFLTSVIGDRRLAQLGESGHGVAEFNAMKVRLIKFLHQDLGFDVIAFESPLFGAFVTDANVGNVSATESMRNSIFGVWHAEEVLPLFEYIKETRSTDRPLTLAGFDMQTSFSAVVGQRPHFLSEVAAHIDSGYALSVEQLDSEMVDARDMGYESHRAFVRENEIRLTTAYQNLVDSLDAYEATLLNIYSDNPAIPKIARQTAWSITHVIARFLEDNYCEGFAIRDLAMAENVDFLLESLYPDKKIVSWAHNVHIRHDNTEVVPGYCPTHRSMGTWISERNREALYTVGLYMYEGRAALNNRTVYTVAVPPAGSLERLFHETGHPFSFVDLLAREEEAGTDWMYRSMKVLSWGKYLNYIVPRNQYDAILFIDEVSPPTYMN